MWNRQAVPDATRTTVAVVTVSYNTRDLTALLLWSLRRVLDWPALEIVVVDSGSTDGSAEFLRAADRAGVCTVIPLERNLGHGLGLNEGLRHIRDGREAVERVWVLDSDCVVARPDVLSIVRGSPMTASAAIVGESHWDRWENRSRFELYSLVIDPAAVARVAGDSPFSEGGDPSLGLLLAAETAGLRLAEFPFSAEGYVIHRGRSSLASVLAADDSKHPMYEWAVNHHEPHFGGVAGARNRYEDLTKRFETEVGKPVAAGLLNFLRRAT